MRPSDRKWGYSFGSRGLMKRSEAEEFLGVSKWTLGRLTTQGMIRKGKCPQTGRIVFCRRSVTEYASSMEVIQ